MFNFKKESCEDIISKGLTKKLSRRRLIRLILAAMAVLGLAGCARFIGLDQEDEEEAGEEAEKAEKEEPVKEETKEEETKEKEVEKGREGMPLRKLGKTGELVSIIGLGGSFTIAASERGDQAERIIHRALDLGVNYLDTAPSYGSSEKNIGQAIKDRRGEVFLASKTLDRTYEGTMALIHQSLKRLKTDHLDLLQVHGLHSADELDQIMADGGALAALERLKQDGLIRFTGVTGHKNPAVLLKALESYDFDCILLSLNPADPYYQSFQEEVLPLAKKKDMGIIAMKIAAYGRIFKDNGLNSMEKALGYALSFPVSSAVVGISTVEEMEENIGIAKEFKQMEPEELKHLEQLVEPYQGEANFFKKVW